MQRMVGFLRATGRLGAAALTGRSTANRWPAVQPSTRGRCDAEKKSHHSRVSAANFSTSSQVSSRHIAWRRHVLATPATAIVCSRFFMIDGAASTQRPARRQSELREEDREGKKAREGEHYPVDGHGSPPLDQEPFSRGESGFCGAGRVSVGATWPARQVRIDTRHDVAMERTGNHGARKRSRTPYSYKLVYPCARGRSTLQWRLDWRKQAQIADAFQQHDTGEIK